MLSSLLVNYRFPVELIDTKNYQLGKITGLSHLETEYQRTVAENVLSLDQTESFIDGNHNCYQNLSLDWRGLKVDQQKLSIPTQYNLLHATEDLCLIFLAKVKITCTLIN